MLIIEISDIFIVPNSSNHTLCFADVIINVNCVIVLSEPSFINEVGIYCSTYFEICDDDDEDTHLYHSHSITVISVVLVDNSNSRLKNY